MKRIIGFFAFFTVVSILCSHTPLLGMTVQDALNSSDGDTVQVSGVITSPNFGTHGTHTEHTLQDPTAAIVVYSNAFDKKLAAGDDITVTGALATYNGKREIIPAGPEDIVINARGVALPETQVVTLGDLLLNPESYESELVRFNNVWIGWGTWPAPGSDANLEITDSSGVVLTMRIDKETNVDESSPPSGVFDLIGVIGQFDPDSPYEEGYQIFPRFDTDIIEESTPTPTVNVTFQADITELLAEGFDLGYHELEVRGDFTGWGPGPVLTQVEENIYAVTVPVEAATGTDIFWKFAVTPGDDFIGGEYELGANRLFTIEANDMILPVEFPNIYTSRKTIAEARSIGIGRVVVIQGVITSPNFSFNTEYTMQDTSAGIVLYEGNTPLWVRFRDQVRVTGRITEYNGKMEIIPESYDGNLESAVMVLESGVQLPAPQVLTIADFLADPEAYESELIRMNQVTITGGTWPASGQDANMDITDVGGWPFVMRIDKETDIDGSVPPESPFDVIGVAGQYDNSAPFDGGYQILPRFLPDIVTGTSGPAVNVTFQADMTNLLAQGFNPEIHFMEIRGFFNGWASGTVLRPNHENPTLYEYTHTFEYHPDSLVAWKFKANPDEEFTNGGWDDGDNRTFVMPETDTIITAIPLIDYLSGAIQQDVTVRFTVDVTGAVNFQTGEPFSNIQQVFLNGVVPGTEWGWATWGSDPDTTGMLSMYNDGSTQGDEIAGDNIWTAEVLFPAGSNPNREYKYGIYDPDNMDASSENALDNETGFEDNHFFSIDDSTPYQTLPTDLWKTREGGGNYMEVPISQVQMDPGMVGQNVIIQGVVTAATGTYNSSQTFIQAGEGGPWSGVLLYDSTFALQANEGDLLTIWGMVGEYYGMTEIFVHQFDLVGTNVPLPPPMVVNTGDFLSSETAEPLEGVLVQVHEAVVSNPDLGYWDWEVDNACIINTRHLHYMSPSTGTGIPSITGIVNYSYEMFKIQPRYRADIMDGLTQSASWDFEEGLEGWKVDGGFGNTSDTHPFSGTYAIEVFNDPDTSTTEITFYNDTFTDFAPNDRIRLHIWLDEFTDVNGIQPFLLFGADQWFNNWYTEQDLNPGAWNLLEVVVPPHYTEPLHMFGVQVVGTAPETVPPFSVDLASVHSGEPPASALVTFQADISELLAEGFDPASHELVVRGDFNGWTGSLLQPVDGNIYSVTVEANGTPGNPVQWKFGANPSEFYLNGGWELGMNRKFMFPAGDTTLAIELPNIYTSGKSIAEARALGVGRVVRTKGIITSYNFGAGYTEYTMQDTSAGIVLFAPEIELPVGFRDRVVVEGRIIEYNGKMEIVPESFEGNPENVVWIVDHGVPVPQEQLLTIPELLASPEDYESELVRIGQAVITDGTWPLEGNNTNLTIMDQAGGSLVMRIDKETDIDGSPAPTDSFTVVGVMSQYDTQAPFDNGYQIMPRRRLDIFENATSVTFQADMRQLLQEGFDPDSNNIAVTGNFVDWQSSYLLYPSETDDSLYSRIVDIRMPPGTDVEWKFYAYPPHQFENNGYETGENRTFVLPEGSFTLDPAIPAITFAELVTQEVTYTFTVDLANAVNAQNGQPLTNVKSVFMHGFRWSPGFALDDTTDMLRTYDDGINGGDAVAGDNIWSNRMTFVPGTNVNQHYKYAAYDPDHLDYSNPEPLDNEAPPGVEHHFVIDDSQPEQLLAVEWLTTSATSYHFDPVYEGNPYLAMNIYVAGASLDGSPLNIGDEIGIFDGENCVGMGVIQQPIAEGEPLAMVAATDDPGTPEKDGFTPGNPIMFRVWDASESQEFAGPEITFLSGSQTFNSQGTSVVDLVFYAVQQQVIPLQGGWNILSLDVEPVDQDMQSLVQPLIDSGNLLKVQDETGAAIEQVLSQWMNNIGNWAVTEGYYLKVTENSDLSVEGFPIPLPLDIDLTSGWNIISYPDNIPQLAMDVVQPLIDGEVLVKIQDETGAAIESILGNWINNIGDFEPGEGYYVKVNAATNLLVGQSGGTVSQSIAQRTEESSTTELKPETYVPSCTGNPYSPMNIYVVLDKARLDELQPGYEIGVFDGDVCVGSCVVPDDYRNRSYLDIIAAMDDPTTEEPDGFQSGAPLSLQLWTGSEHLYGAFTSLGKSSTPEAVLFEERATAVLQVNGWQVTAFNPEMGVPTEYELAMAYPNPFNPSTTIQYGVPEAADVTIQVYNMAGQLVNTLVSEQLQPGYYTTVWHGQNLHGQQVATGVYFYQMRAGSKIMTKKVIFMK